MRDKSAGHLEHKDQGLPHRRGLQQVVDRVLQGRQRRRWFAGAVMLALILVVLSIVLGVPRIEFLPPLGVVAGILVVACLLVCAGAAWGEARAARIAEDAINRLVLRRRKP